MDLVLAIIIVVSVLALVFFLTANRFSRVEGEVISSLVRGRFKGEKQRTEAGTGKAEISNLTGRDIKIGDVTGADSPDATQGDVHVADLQAQRDIDLGNLTGLRNRNTED